MKDLPITVLMSCFNSEKFIKKTIVSVLNQSYVNFEFIIVNDGSTDQTFNIIQDFANIDKRIIAINKNNTGLSDSLNEGLNIAQGEYIVRIDADDICLPDRFKLQYNFLKNNSSYVLCSSSVYFIDEADLIIGRSFPLTLNWAIKKDLKYNNPVAHPTVMIRKKTLVKVGGYSKIIKQYFEDYFLWNLLIKEGKFHTITQPLIKYRLLNNSLSTRVSKELIFKLSELVQKIYITESDYKELLEIRNEAKIVNYENITTKMKFSLFVDKIYFFPDFICLLKNYLLQFKVIK